MRALFVHDHRFSVAPSGAVYSPGKYPHAVWQRYLKHFTELVVVGRSRLVSEEQATRMDVSGGSRVSFVFVPSLTDSWLGFRYWAQVVRVLKQQIEKADAVIARSGLLGMLAASLARKMGKPCSVEVVGDVWDAYWNYGGMAGKVYAPPGLVDGAALPWEGGLCDLCYARNPPTPISVPRGVRQCVKCRNHARSGNRP